VLGDLSADAGKQDEAAEHYRQALDIARSVSMKLVLIEALLARGWWEARRQHDPVAAFSDLTEALNYARTGGYRICEADIRVGLAWANLAARNEKSAREEAAYALQISEGMGYYWGKVDAEEVLAEIASRETLAARE
jgi:Tfp pilus assembly protein PilF